MGLIMQDYTSKDSISQRALRAVDVCHQTGISRTHLYRLVGKGLFPSPVKISDRVTVWREADVQRWLSEKFATSMAIVGSGHE
jgi:prophage regulatory protein